MTWWWVPRVAGLRLPSAIACCLQQEQTLAQCLPALTSIECSCACGRARLLSQALNADVHVDERAWVSVCVRAFENGRLRVRVLCPPRAQAYNDKHNGANGEDNRDGSNDNFSWNCGVEGATDNEGVLALRERQMRNMMVALMVSQGTPMMVMGECARARA